MPRLLEETEIRFEVADLARMVPISKPQQNGYVELPHRTEGVHLSDILRYIAIKTKILKPDERTDDLPMQWAVGLAWEWFSAGLYPNMCWQPGEISLDGIYMSADGYSDEIGPQIDEFKATWLRLLSGKELLAKPLYMWQGMGYAKGFSTRLVRWHFLYLNGAYEWHRGGAPRYIRYLVEFTPEEIDQNWRMVLASRDKVLRQVVSA